MPSIVRCPKCRAEVHLPDRPVHKTCCIKCKAVFPVQPAVPPVPPGNSPAVPADQRMVSTLQAPDSQHFHHGLAFGRKVRWAILGLVVLLLGAYGVKWLTPGRPPVDQHAPALPEGIAQNAAERPEGNQAEANPVPAGDQQPELKVANAANPESPKGIAEPRRGLIQEKEEPKKESADLVQNDAKIKEKLEPQFTFRTDGGEVSFAAFSPDGKWVVSISESEDRGEAKVWDLNTGQTILTITGRPEQWYGRAAFSPDGKFLAIVSARYSKDRGPLLYSVEIRDALKGLEVRSLSPNFDIKGVAYSQDGKRLAVAGGGLQGKGKALDPNSGREVFSFTGKNTFMDLSYSPDGHRLAVPTGAGKTLTLFDSTTGLEQSTIPGFSGNPIRLAYSPDGKFLASLAVKMEMQGLEILKESFEIKIWNCITGREEFSINEPLGGAWSIAFSADGKWLASSSGKNIFDKNGNGPVDGWGDLMVWEVNKKKKMATFRGHDWPIRWLAFSPDGTRLASASEDRTVKILDLAKVVGRPIEFVPVFVTKPPEKATPSEAEASRKLKLARAMLRDADDAKLNGNAALGSSLKDKARNRLREIADKYRDTVAGKEAKELLEKLNN